MPSSRTDRFATKSKLAAIEPNGPLGIMRETTKIDLTIDEHEYSRGMRAFALDAGAQDIISDLPFGEKPAWGWVASPTRSRILATGTRRTDPPKGRDRASACDAREPSGELLFVTVRLTAAGANASATNVRSGDFIPESGPEAFHPIEPIEAEPADA